MEIMHASHKTERCVACGKIGTLLQDRFLVPLILMLKKKMCMINKKKMYLVLNFLLLTFIFSVHIKACFPV